MADDDDLLDGELNWRDPVVDRRIFKTRPAGVHVMNAIAGVSWLVLVGIGLSLQGGASAEKGVGSLIVFFSIAIVAFIVSIWSSRRIWRAIGPALRSMLRPLGVFGPLPMILAIVVGVGMIASLPQLLLRQMGAAEASALEGVDFAAMLDAGGNFYETTASEARSRCTEKGDGWRLPRRGDEPFLGERLLGSIFRHRALHAEKEPSDPKTGISTFTYDSRERRFFRTNMINQHRACVVCIKR